MTKKYTIEDMQKMVVEKKGKCLSNEYINMRTKLKWKCEHNHVWETTPLLINTGAWCPCCQNKSEQKFREVIEEYFDAEFLISYPNWLINPKTGYPLELDGYNEELGIAFEYQGEQHFKPTKHFGGQERLKQRKKIDQIKKEVCNKRGIILLCPTYELDESEYEDFIRENIGQLGDNND